MVSEDTDIVLELRAMSFLLGVDISVFLCPKQGQEFKP